MKYKLEDQVVTSIGIVGKIVSLREVTRLNDRPIFGHRTEQYTEYLVGDCNFNAKTNKFDLTGEWVNEEDIAYKVNKPQLSLWKKILGGNN